MSDILYRALLKLIVNYRILAKFEGDDEGGNNAHAMAIYIRSADIYILPAWATVAYPSPWQSEKPDSWISQYSPCAFVILYRLQFLGGLRDTVESNN